MSRHMEAWMDGVALSTVGPVLIRQVYEDPPTMEILNGDRPGRYGQRTLGIKRQSLKVAIECQVRELFDLAARSRTVEDMAKWASGSVLELSNHPYRRLHVYLSAEPALGEVRDYTSTIRMEFTADEIPYWEDCVPETVTLTGDDEDDTLLVPGSAPAPVCLTVSLVPPEEPEETEEETDPEEEPEEASDPELTSFSVTVGGQTISLTGLSVSLTDTLVFERDALDNLMIRSGSTVLLSKRSAESADDLMTAPGHADVSFESDVACEVTFSVNGRWK